MKIISLLLGICFYSSFGYAQNYTKDNIWQQLLATQWKVKYNAQIKEEIEYPVFQAGLKLLNGKEVQITGYIVPTDKKEKYTVLSAYPNSSCFFCGGAGMESIVEVYLKTPRTFKIDQIVTFKGKLKLNDTDINHLIYILEEAVLVE
jgi:hypothetical protein